MSAEQNAGNREGYPSSSTSGNYQREFKPGRSPRPRIHTGQPRPYNAERPNYHKQNDDEGGFRPEGFGAGLQSTPQRGSYRPRNTYNQQGGGYQPRPQGGGYQGRSYNAQQGYQSRPQQGGYRPRYNSNEGDGQGYQQGGYQNRAPQGQPYRRQQFDEPSYNPAPNMQPRQGEGGSEPDPLNNLDDIPF